MCTLAEGAPAILGEPKDLSSEGEERGGLDHPAYFFARPGKVKDRFI
jgi:hypothetical protein